MSFWDRSRAVLARTSESSDVASARRRRDNETPGSDEDVVEAKQYVPDFEKCTALTAEILLHHQSHHERDSKDEALSACFQATSL